VVQCHQQYHYMIQQHLLRRHDPFYDSYRSDRQLYEQVYRPSPMEPVIVDEFEDEMIFPTGYEEDYEYREDIIKPNQAIDLDDSLNNNQQIMIDRVEQLFYLLHHLQLL